MSGKKNYYAEGKAKTVEEAMEYQNSFAEGKQYSYGEMADIQGRLEKLGKRYGLLREFRENGII